MVAPGRRKGAVRRLRRKGKGRGRTPRPVEKTEEHELLRDLPEELDDDTKVAKRVAWLNKFGHLSQQINFAEVAEPLDTLKVPHAMGLLRELEMHGTKVSDPTDWIKRAVEEVGSDAMEEDDDAVEDKLTELNTSGRLLAPIQVAEVKGGLERLPEEDALDLLQDVLNRGSSVKNPTAFIRSKLKARSAVLGVSLDTMDEHSKILKRIEWLNDYGGLLKKINYVKVAAVLEKDRAAGDPRFDGIPEPTAFILRQPPGGLLPTARTFQASADFAAPLTATEALKNFMDFLNTGPRMRRRCVNAVEVAEALKCLPPKRVARVLHEMQEHGLGLDDPVSYIKAAARSGSSVKRGPAEAAGEDVEKDDMISTLTSRVKWLNEFGGLAKKISIDEVIGALYCLGLPQSMAILRSLQERGASVVDPNHYINQAVQRANSNMAKEEKEDDQDEDQEPAADPEAEDEPAEQGGSPEEEETIDRTNEDWFDWAAAEEPKSKRRVPKRPAEVAATSLAPPVEAAAKVRRVVGGLTGYQRLVPSGATEKALNAQRPPRGVKSEPAGGEEDAEVKADAGPSHYSSGPVALPMSPEEKMMQVRNYAESHSIRLDDQCAKKLSRLPWFRAKDLIDEVLLGGRDRQGVRNPSRYLNNRVEKLTVPLGVEQGIAMELAVSLGVVLNNDALDELASIPRKESHAIIRELAKGSHGSDPMSYVMEEVYKCREYFKSLTNDENDDFEVQD